MEEYSLMTETGLASTIRPTALAAMLETSRAARQLVLYRGALTPRELDAPETETEALAHGAAVHDLGWLRRVSVRGEDRFRWLSGMVTNTVNDLFPNSGAWNFVLNVQGKIQGDLTVWRGGEELSPHLRKTVSQPFHGAAAGDRLLGTPFAGESGLELEIAADQFDKLLAHLNRFIVMDDVELIPLGIESPGEAGSETAVGLTGPLAGEVLERLGLPVFAQPMTGTNVEWNGLGLRMVRGYGVLAPHYQLWAPSADLPLLWSALRTAGATPIGGDSWNAFRVAEGIPLYGIDISERDLPQETSQLRALHFNKGCYLGQEIVERIRSRGAVHRYLRPLELTGAMPPAGAELTMDDGSPAGQITSAAELRLPGRRPVLALAMMRAEAEAGNQRFTYAAGETTGSARILDRPPTF